jgi:hypothetical protein
MAMASTVRVWNVGPHDLEIRPGSLAWPEAVAVVEVGGVVEVAADLAGRPPGPWKALGDGGAPADDGRLYRPAGDRWEVRDPGAGLLAQDTVWSPSAPDTKSSPAAAPVKGA